MKHNIKMLVIWDSIEDESSSENLKPQPSITVLEEICSRWL